MIVKCSIRQRKCFKNVLNYKEKYKVLRYTWIVERNISIKKTIKKQKFGTKKRQKLEKVNRLIFSWEVAIINNVIILMRLKYLTRYLK